MSIIARRRGRYGILLLLPPRTVVVVVVGVVGTPRAIAMIVVGISRVRIRGCMCVMGMIIAESVRIGGIEEKYEKNNAMLKFLDHNCN